MKRYKWTLKRGEYYPHGYVEAFDFQEAFKVFLESFDPFSGFEIYRFELAR